MASTATKPAEARRPRAVQVSNPAVLDMIFEAVRKEIGRNYAEAAENLIIAGFNLMKDRQPTAAGTQE